MGSRSRKGAAPVFCILIFLYSKIIFEIYQLSIDICFGICFNIDMIKAILTPREAEVLRRRTEEDQTLEEIAQFFSVTRERIRQIQTKAERKLGLEHFRRKPAPDKTCLQCGIIYSGRHKSNYCSKQCWHDSRVIKKNCSQCGIEFTSLSMKARIKRNRSGLFFCSRRCQGIWLGHHYSRGRPQTKHFSLEIRLPFEFRVRLTRVAKYRTLQTK